MSVHDFDSKNWVCTRCRRTAQTHEHNTFDQALNARAIISMFVLVSVLLRRGGGLVTAVLDDPPGGGLRHFVAEFDHSAYAEGSRDTYFVCIDLGDLLDLLVGHGAVSRDVLVTLDMHIHIHPPQDQPTLGDTAHQNTRRSLGALIGCSRLRTLTIIYGEPESRPIRSWCRRTLTNALPVLLPDQFSSTPAPHPASRHLSERPRTGRRPRSCVSSSVIDRLADTLCDWERYQRSELCGCGHSSDGPEDDGLLEVPRGPREVSKRVFVPFAIRARTRTSMRSLCSENLLGTERSTKKSRWWRLVNPSDQQRDRREEGTKARARVAETGFCSSDE
ncbi:uncharacterized protein BXZ73DRAFT_107915 [Epithele typhae]|uniref:uncharacterized protein n=1 Tax=Epithele typhae TaxID=378194 RepID=UPI002008E48B|nr:uncharacterized protein BXZ73DRAFT_107915 [Epithele typhae]KAH9911531.1 hypothetical protein BXZ73DRAFT_107915 [Epithele typhae]